MALKAECGWARVCIRQTKELCLNLKKSPSEGSAKFGARVLAERHKLYTEHFKEYPQFALGQYDFNRVCKTIDDKGYQLEEQRGQRSLFSNICNG